MRISGNRARKYAFWTSPQMMLTLLVWEPYSRKHCIRGSQHGLTYQNLRDFHCFKWKLYLHGAKSLLELRALTFLVIWFLSRPCCLGQSQQESFIPGSGLCRLKNKPIITEQRMASTSPTGKSWHKSNKWNVLVCFRNECLGPFQKVF